MAELYATELLGIRSPLGTSDELRLTTQLALYLTLFHLCGILHLFHASLSGESLLIGSFYGIAHIEVILRHEDSICRHKREESHLILTYRGQLRHYLYPILLFLRELVFNLEGAYGIDIVAEEVYTIGILARE